MKFREFGLLFFIIRYTNLFEASPTANFFRFPSCIPKKVREVPHNTQPSVSRAMKDAALGILSAGTRGNYWNDRLRHLARESKLSDKNMPTFPKNGKRVVKTAPKVACRDFTASVRDVYGHNMHTSSTTSGNDVLRANHFGYG
ncbi:hypothetical protein ACFE04_029066 [Oxalis oulophora]